MVDTFKPKLVGSEDKFMLSKATSQGGIAPQLVMEGGNHPTTLLLVHSIDLWIGGTMEQKMERALAAKHEMEVELEMVKFQLINAKLSRADIASDELEKVKKQLQQMMAEKGISIDLSGLTRRKTSAAGGDPAEVSRLKAEVLSCPPR